MEVPHFGVGLFLCLVFGGVGVFLYTFRVFPLYRIYKTLIFAS